MFPESFFVAVWALSSTVCGRFEDVLPLHAQSSLLCRYAASHFVFMGLGIYVDVILTQWSRSASVAQGREDEKGVHAH